MVGIMDGDMDMDTHNNNNNKGVLFDIQVHSREHLHMTKDIHDLHKTRKNRPTVAAAHAT